ncbi:MAG: tRNA (guanosine(46)-N7)-methyltransferase TrmB [Planctomycetota bacterium]
MPRRALRKLDPTIDLSGILLQPEDVPRPWDAQRLFGRTAPLQVEVGSGKGLFLENAAAADPASNFFGIEVAGKYARRCAERLAKRSLTNGRMLAGDALWLFRDVLPDACVADVHVYFPDPWWKARHHKRRVLNGPFVADVTRVLLPGGRLHFWTDVREYYEATLELLAAETPLEGPHSVDARPAEHDLDYRTHFERRTRKAGEPVYRCQFTKPAAGPPVSATDTPAG